MPPVGHVVARGGDAPGLGVAEVDAAHLAVERERGLAGQRAQHLREVERRVEGAGGADQRLVLLGACLGPLLGLQAREAGGGLVGQRGRDGDLGVGELPALVVDGDRDVADLAAPARRARTARRRRRSARRGRPEDPPSHGRRRRGTAARWPPPGPCPRRAGRAPGRSPPRRSRPRSAPASRRRRPGRSRTAGPGRRRARAGARCSAPGASASSFSARERNLPPIQKRLPACCWSVERVEPYPGHHKTLAIDLAFAAGT